MIKLADTKKCTACSACLNICKHSAITMKVNNEGFYYPHIDEFVCKKCGLCTRVCPILSSQKTNYNKPSSTYAVINYKDRNISSSGGAFSFIAEWILNNEGVVYGVEYTDNHEAVHRKITNLSDLNILRGSKYVQSKIGLTFRSVKEALLEGRLVLFSGTPCQVDGLLTYLGKKYDTLYTIDIVCHGVPSYGMFQQYLTKLANEVLNLPYEDIECFKFRQLSTWDYRSSVLIKNKGWVVLDKSSDTYMSAFFKGYIFRESCYNCKYAGIHRVGTFTIADFWGIGCHGRKFKPMVMSGVSLLIDNEGKFKDIPKPSYLYVEKRELSEAQLENHNLNNPVKRPIARDTAGVDLINNSITLNEYSQKYKITTGNKLKYKVLNFFKDALYKLNLYNIFKSIKYKLR